MSTLNHNDRKHALLSASGASKWLNCPPSARLEDTIASEDTIYTLEGTLAHEVAEVTVRNSGKVPQKVLKQFQAHELFSPEMVDHAKDYYAFIRSKMTEDTQCLVETQVTYDRWAPEGFGTCDCILMGDKKLTIIDYKYGKGVKVEASKSPQVLLYALGAIEEFGYCHDFELVECCIFQPRLANVSSYEISVQDLLTWAETTVKPSAQLAFKGQGEFKAGGHCRFCQGADRCKALSVYACECVKEASPELLTPEDYAEILGRMPLIKNWLGKVEARALGLLMADEQAIPGWKAVEGRSVRKYRDKELCVQALKDAGYADEKIYKPSELIGITEMTKLLGAKQFEEILGGLIDKPEGKPTLAEADDPRPALSTTSMFEAIYN